MLAFADLQESVPEDHPLRAIEAVANEALERLCGAGRGRRGRGRPTATRDAEAVLGT